MTCKDSPPAPDRMRAIDLYAGIGGWSLGLHLAGVDVVASYEYWKPAIATHSANHGKNFAPVDIRALNLDQLPEGIDLVVGSPPCTEFSYSNRGGKGNVAEGMKDLVKFFEVVQHLNPEFWAMENVPRVAKVLAAGFSEPGHPLYPFRNLGHQIHVVDFSDYGTPQARKRCIATNIPFEFLEQYKGSLERRTLGDVIEALNAEGPIHDPVWGVTIEQDQLSDMEFEPPLNAEELRMNREAKEFHPIYNNMAFPEFLGKPSRTVTATCTRVSRESLVIADPSNRKDFRRLTVRERACLQGFPITYQFHAKSFAEKVKMVGNAIPPTIPYLLALAANGISSEEFKGYGHASDNLKVPEKLGTLTLPDREGRKFPAKRKFRAAIPNLRFKSGMRFELANKTDGLEPEWAVRFFYGSSKDIREVELDGSATHSFNSRKIIAPVVASMHHKFVSELRRLEQTTPHGLQEVWTHRTNGLGPFEVVDALGRLSMDMILHLEQMLDEAQVECVENFIIHIAESSSNGGRVQSASKLRKFALPVLAGMLIGDWFNAVGWHQVRRQAA